jgi:hypothetical protein
MEELKTKRFLWGVLLTWLPLIPLGIPLVHSFRGISEQKATGLGVVAVGLAEVYLRFGVGITLLFEVTAIVLLVRAFSRGHWLRASFSVGSICLSLIVISLFGLFVWLFLST